MNYTHDHQNLLSNDMIKKKRRMNRGMRLSSNPKENSVKDLEKMLR